MKRSFECLLAELCAPTLACVKPGSLFRYLPAPGENARAQAVFWDAALRPRGVAVRILKACEATGAVLVYVFRPGWLAQILAQAEVQRFLRRRGYDAPADAEAVLMQLSERLAREAAFPHEIGIFLGYPLDDVIGFIKNRGQNYTCCGYWKAYGDPAQARRCFERYRKCEQVYKRLHDQGRPVWRLTVAV